ncbi:MAG: hypothetical protein SFT91_01990 [Rickettsiaceae bacterium]|nr:hypothetical protein [Rickettsiaceae bacterium]
MKRANFIPTSVMNISSPPATSEEINKQSEIISLDTTFSRVVSDSSKLSHLVMSSYDARDSKLKSIIYTKNQNHESASDVLRIASLINPSVKIDDLSTKLLAEINDQKIVILSMCKLGLPSGRRG